MRSAVGLLIAVGLALPQTAVAARSAERPSPPSSANQRPIPSAGPVQTGGSANVSSSSVDPRPGNNSAQVATTVGDPSYLDIVEQYRRGAFEDAVAALASHPDAYKPAFVLRQVERLHPDASAPVATMLPLAKRIVSMRLSPVLPAAAVLHVEAGHALLQKADAVRGVGHLMAARAIVDGDWWTTVAQMVPDSAAHYGRVRLDVYLAILFALQQQYQFDALLPHLARAREQFPRDADIRLASGTLDELRATPTMLRRLEAPAGRPPAAHWRRDRQWEYLDRAAEHFRAALRLDDRLTEARVRLGRVLQERGKLPEARRELEAALTGTPPAILSYLGSLFLGEILEAQHDAAGAVARYQVAVTRAPACQSAHLALSRAFETAGDRQAARAALQPLWREDSERTCVDPWWLYNLGQSWRLRGFVEDLRGRVTAAKVIARATAGAPAIAPASAGAGAAVR